jgi:hypothetical protein
VNVGLSIIVIVGLVPRIGTSMAVYPSPWHGLNDDDDDGGGRYHLFI